MSWKKQREGECHEAKPPALDTFLNGFISINVFLLFIFEAEVFPIHVPPTLIWPKQKLDWDGIKVLQ